MRQWAAALFAIAALAPTEAGAAGAVIGKEGETVTVLLARVAVATTPGRTTLWAQVSVTGASAGFVWIMPVRPGARIDLGSDAWLDALDAATSPVVLPPSTPTACDAGLAPERLAPATSPHSTLPTSTGLFTDPGALGSFVSGAGYVLPPGLATALEPIFASGAAVIASTYLSAALPARTWRVVDSGPPVLPFALTGAAEATTQVTAFVLASAGATAGTSPLTLDPSRVLWESEGLSTFAQARAALLESWQGARWLTESALPDLLFDGAPIGPGASLPAVIGQYFTLASDYGDATGDPVECAAAAAATSLDPEAYVASCPAGASGVVPGPSPCSTGTDGGAPTDALLCGGSDDAALAVGGLAAADVWISRIEGIVTASSASDVPLSVVATAPTSPVLTANGYASDCVQTPAPAATSVPSLQPSPSPAGPSSESQAASSVAPAAAEGCSGVADSCASSDSTDDGTDDGDACGGGGSSSPSGDSCGSDASSSSDCATGGRARRPRGRSPVSRLLLLLVAGLAVARRRASRSRLRSESSSCPRLRPPPPRRPARRGIG